ncbi:MAG TPA: hypothetical protein PK306_04155 [Aquabacterium sp.]|nr:hypothetical protein [Aquabacterium sp.]HQC94881.1 hypothetical protein [Aquabacterium sp.]
MSDADHWRAEAAMHRVLRRTLPAQRHDVLGALSALKLQLAVARRRTQRPDGQAMPDDDPAVRMSQLEAMAGQHLAAQTALTELRLWDGVTVQRRALDEVIGQCLHWVRQAAALRGLRIDALQCGCDDAAATDDDPAEGLPWVEVPAAHFLVLGLAYATMDTLQGQPARLVPVLDSHPAGWTLAFQARDWADGDAPPAAAGGASPPDGRPTPALPAGQPLPDIPPQLLAALASFCSGEDARWSVGQADAARQFPALPALQLALVDAPA